jgi:hypothetical protein
MTMTLPQISSIAAYAALPSAFQVVVSNYGSAEVSINSCPSPSICSTPTTINGSSNPYVIFPGSSALFVADASANYAGIPLGIPSVSALAVGGSTTNTETFGGSSTSSYLFNGTTSTPATFPGNVVLTNGNVNANSFGLKSGGVAGSQNLYVPAYSITGITGLSNVGATGTLTFTSNTLPFTNPQLIVISGSSNSTFNTTSCVSGACPIVSATSTQITFTYTANPTGSYTSGAAASIYPTGCALGDCIGFSTAGTLAGYVDLSNNLQWINGNIQVDNAANGGSNSNSVRSPSFTLYSGGTFAASGGANIYEDTASSGCSTGTPCVAFGAGGAQAARVDGTGSITAVSKIIGASLSPQGTTIPTAQGIYSAASSPNCNGTGSGSYCLGLGTAGLLGAYIDKNQNLDLGVVNQTNGSTGQSGGGIMQYGSYTSLSTNFTVISSTACWVNGSTVATGTLTPTGGSFTLAGATAGNCVVQIGGNFTGSKLPTANNQWGCGGYDVSAATVAQASVVQASTSTYPTGLTYSCYVRFTASGSTDTVDFFLWNW